MVFLQVNFQIYLSSPAGFETASQCSPLRSLLKTRYVFLFPSTYPALTLTGNSLHKNCRNFSFLVDFFSEFL